MVEVDMDKPQILLFVTPDGLDRTEVLSPNEDQKDLAMETYTKFAFEIHRFGQRLDQILEAETGKKNGDGIRICE